MSKYRFCLPLHQERGRTCLETSAGPKALPAVQEAAANLPPTWIPSRNEPLDAVQLGRRSCSSRSFTGAGGGGSRDGTGMEGAGAGMEARCGSGDGWWMSWMCSGCQGWGAEHQGTGTGSREGHQGHLPCRLRLCARAGAGHHPGLGFGDVVPWDPAQQGQEGQSRAQRL